MPYYHTTTRDRRKAILREGLHFRERRHYTDDTSPHGVYLFNDLDKAITNAIHLEAVGHRPTLMDESAADWSAQLRSYREDLRALLERGGGIGDVWQVDASGLPVQEDPYRISMPSGKHADPDAWYCPIEIEPNRIRLVEVEQSRAMQALFANIFTCDRMIQEADELGKFPDWLNGFIESVTETPAALSLIHGTDHWARVASVGMELAAETPEADALVVLLFACLHDVARVSDGDDPEHGARAAFLVRTLALPITEQQLELLAYALEHHTGGETTADPTIGVCWDADRLDLTRLGMSVDPRFLSTQAARDLATPPRRAGRNEPCPCESGIKYKKCHGA